MTTANLESTGQLRLESQRLAFSMVLNIVWFHRSGQIISMSGQTLQIMDLETFEVFETQAADDEMKDKIRQGGEVEYWKVLERIKVVRVKS